VPLRAAQDHDAPVPDARSLPRRSYALACAGPEIRPLREIERQYILAALQCNGGNRTRTAQQLRINDMTLLRKPKSYAKAS
jgi:DNA-binding NtrC family response regulator